ncbi:zinc knuckle-domain-containing protein [Roridomyces roridus]|uniref:Zinc knuckle-domain-containing protein n=1 Tax=Roridomyces roridus TaxID=1738132 RepID=A0AAD7FYD4_9AGAR|nr:zinc knuckle-domain-containing protein [Roridomyces roridus]
MSKYAPHGHSTNRARATQSTICQKCLKTGHFIYECKSTRPYVSRPSRTQQLENPNALAKLKAAGKPSVEVPEEFKKKDGTANRILEAKEKERENAGVGKGKQKETKKARRSSRSSSDSDSDSDSDSSSSSGSGSDSSSDSGRSRERDRKRRVPTKRDRSRST